MTCVVLPALAQRLAELVVVLALIFVEELEHGVRSTIYTLAATAIRPTPTNDTQPRRDWPACVATAEENSGTRTNCFTLVRLAVWYLNWLVSQQKAELYTDSNWSSKTE